ncbi:MAG: NAD(P)/FAD-dependent oxidoreductase [Candidatus Latescibacterota bacterium]|jgi:NADH dehydrogenase
MNSTVAMPSRVVIVGGGFAGLYAAKALRKARAEVTLIDKRNFHLFQPLLYQVATGGLSPGDIASPLRAVLKRHRNTRVLAAEMVDLDPERRRVLLRDGELPYDLLALALGGQNQYFGHDDWPGTAPGLKTIEDALEVRRRIFLAFETAERQEDERSRRAWMRFVVVGGGPTGVELAGALAELAHTTLRHDFRRINPRAAEVILVEGSPRILPPYPPSLSSRAASSLRRLGVEVRTGTRMAAIDDDGVTLKRGETIEEVHAHTVLWAAGMQASGLSATIARRLGAKTDHGGRLLVEPDLSLPGHPEIFVLGDLAHYAHQGTAPLPAVAPVAMQQGRYLARLIQRRLRGRPTGPFHYRDRGSLAVIGRHAAVADLGALHVAGWPAWLAWIFVHIGYLIEFDSKVMVMFQWGWNYLTRKKGARLVTGGDFATRLHVGPGKRG